MATFRKPLGNLAETARKNSGKEQENFGKRADSVELKNRKRAEDDARGTEKRCIEDRTAMR